MFYLLQVGLKSFSRFVLSLSDSTLFCFVYNSKYFLFLDNFILNGHKKYLTTTAIMLATIEEINSRFLYTTQMTLCGVGSQCKHNIEVYVFWIWMEPFDIVAPREIHDTDRRLIKNTPLSLFYVRTEKYPISSSSFSIFPFSVHNFISLYFVWPQKKLKGSKVSYFKCCITMA